MDWPKRIAIGSDHAGYTLKQELIDFLRDQDVECIDVGTHGPESVDYPDFAHELASQLKSGSADYGILICGTANGISITANKHQHIRAAIAWSTDIARMARLHNDANVLCLPARVIATTLAKDCVDVFFHTDFEGGRHERRVNKMSC